MHVEAASGFSGPSDGRAKEPLRRSGLDGVGDVPWGTHFCQFYATGEDLLDTLAPYLVAGLEANEFCMWIASHPLGVEEAKAGFCRLAPPGSERFLAEGQLEILDYGEWYEDHGSFDADRVVQGWLDKLDLALQRGFDGLRVTGNTYWLEHGDWENFSRYEADVGSIIAPRRILALCTYSLEKCGAPEILDVVANHQFALVRRGGRWESVKSLAYERARQALDESEERFRLLMEGVRDHAILMLDPDGRIVSWNEGAERIGGWSADEAMGRHVSLLHPEDDDHWRHELQLAAAHGSFKEEGGRIRKDGSLFHAVVLITSLFDEQGRLRGYAKVIRDASEQERARDEALASEARLRATIDGAVEAIVTFDESGVVLSLNSPALRLFGYEPTEAIGKNIELLTPELFGGERDFRLDDYLATGESNGVGREVVGRRKDGSALLLALTIYEAGSGGPRSFIGFLREPTDGCEGEARVRQMHADRLELMALMATGVAHEVNQPLSAVATYLSTARRLLQRPETSAEQIDSVLASAAAQVMRAGQIISHLRGSMTRREPDKTLQSLHEVIRAACDLTDANAKNLKVEVTLRLQAELDRVIVDKAQIQQVLASLNRNAIEAMRGSQRRELSIATSLSDDGLIRTDVSDTGPGLSREFLDGLFEPFLTTKAHGLGVGLSTSRSIVEAHYGKLWAEPNPLGGAILSFTLPLAREDHAGRLVLDP